MKKIRQSFFMALLLCVHPLMSDSNIVTSINKSSGDSVSAWENFNGMGNTIIAAVQEAGIWGTAQAIADVATYPYSPVTASNTSDQFAVVWLGTDPVTSVQSLYGSFYDNTSGSWTTSLISVPAIEYVIGDHQVEIANNGAVVVTWTSFINATGVYKSRGLYSSTFGTWTTPISLD